MLVAAYARRLNASLVAGGADHSFGIEVARMAGLPPEVVGRAKEVLRHLQAHDVAAEVGVGGRLSADDVSPEAAGAVSGDGALAMPVVSSGQASGVPAPSRAVEFVPDPAGESLKEELRALDPDRMTPIEALMALSELKRFV